jgi:hypothetical protein
VPVYVILTADEIYGSATGVGSRAERASEADLLAQNIAYGQQVDMSDGTDDGGDFREVNIAAPAGGRSAVNDTAAVFAASLTGYQEAARLAGTGGTVGIMVGHGNSGETGNAFADMAPGRHLRLTIDQIQRWGAALDNPVPRLTPSQLFLESVKAALTEHGVTRIDLLNCDVGGGSEGQQLLNLMHLRFGITVRGLNGYLRGDWSGRGRSRTVTMSLVRLPAGASAAEAMAPDARLIHPSTDEIFPDADFRVSRPPRD